MTNINAIKKFKLINNFHSTTAHATALIIILFLFSNLSHAVPTGSAPPPDQQEVIYKLVTLTDSEDIIPYTTVKFPSLNLQTTTNDKGEGAVRTYPSPVLHAYIANTSNYYGEGNVKFTQTPETFNIRLQLKVNSNNNSDLININENEIKTEENTVKITKIDPVPEENKSLTDQLIEELSNDSETARKFMEVTGIKEQDERIRFENIDCDAEGSEENLCCVVGDEIFEVWFKQQHELGIVIGGELTCSVQGTIKQNIKIIELCATEHKYRAGGVIKDYGRICEYLPATTIETKSGDTDITILPPQSKEEKEEFYKNLAQATNPQAGEDEESSNALTNLLIAAALITLIFIGAKVLLKKEEKEPRNTH